MTKSTRRRICILFLYLIVPSAYAGLIERVSVSSSGAQGNNSSSISSISADGRFVAFQSRATNLVVAGDTNQRNDIFVHDRDTGITERVSMSPSGVLGNGLSEYPSISADGRFVAFESTATNLVGSDTNSTREIYVYDRDTGVTERVSVSSTGEKGNSISARPSISADGRFVVFQSWGVNLVAGDTNKRNDIFVHDRDTGVTERVSVSSNGAQGDSSSSNSSISADGRFVAFQSYATNLVAGDTNSQFDIFIHDRDTGITERVSVSSSGAQGIYGSSSPSISADGRFVAFSGANLVAGDTNKWGDVFVHDRDTEITERVSVTSSGVQGNASSGSNSISVDGRFVAFTSRATNLVAGDTNAAQDVFIHDRDTGITERVSVSQAGAQGYRDSRIHSISADGRFVTFESLASSLVAGDTNLHIDIFVAENPLIFNLVGEPDIDATTESGVFIWRAADGRTLMQVVAGDPAQNGQITDFQGSITSGSVIGNLHPIGLESSDSLIQRTMNRIDFDFLAQRPWNDRISFVADVNESLCLALSAYVGGLYLGPNKVEVTPPYDIHSMARCDVLEGEPVIDGSSVSGVYIWREADARTLMQVVAGDPAENDQITGFQGSITSGSAISALVPINLESSDSLVQSAMNRVDFDLLAQRPWNDRISFVADITDSLCVVLGAYTDGLYLGRNKVEVTPPYDIHTMVGCGSPTIFNYFAIFHSTPGVRDLGPQAISVSVDSNTGIASVKAINAAANVSPEIDLNIDGTPSSNFIGTIEAACGGVSLPESSSWSVMGYSIGDNSINIQSSGGRGSWSVSVPLGTGTLPDLCDPTSRDSETDGSSISTSSGPKYRPPQVVMADAPASLGGG